MSRYPALLVLAFVVLITPPALATSIPNNSFETNPTGTWVTSVPNWTLTPALTATGQRRAGLFFTFDGFNPAEGLAFAIITHRGTGASG